MMPKKKSTIVLWLGIGILIGLLIGFSLCRVVDTCDLNDPECESNCLTVFAHDKDYVAIEGANIELFYANGTLIASGVTDASGFYTAYVDVFGCGGDDGYLTYDYSYEGVQGGIENYTGQIGFSGSDDPCTLTGTGCCLMTILIDG